MLRTKFFLPGLAMALAAGAFAQDGTDTCTTPTAIGEGTFVFNTTTALASAGHADGICGDAGFPDFNYDMFWVVTAVTAGNMDIDTFGSTFDTVLAVYDGIDCAATCLAENDDSGGAQSKVTIAGVNIGDTFLVQVGGYNATTGFGSGTLNVTVNTPPPPLTNDDCSTATTLTGTGAFAWDNTGATTSGFLGATGTYDTVKSDIFYQWTAPVAGDFIFDTRGSGFDTKLAVHNGVGCAATFGAYNDDAANPFTTASEVSLAGLLAGDNVLIQVGSYSTTFQAAGVLNITQFIDPCIGAIDDGMEENDSCAAAGALALGVHTNLFVSDSDADYYAITIPSGDILTIGSTILTGDVDYNLYDNSCALIGAIFPTDTYSNLSAAPVTVVLEVLNYNSGTSTCATYDLDLSSAPDPCFGMDDALEDNDDCASATPVVDGTITGLFVAKSDKDHYSMCVADGATVTLDILFTNANGDLDMFLREATSTQCGLGNGTEELADGFSVTDNENIVWTNTLGYDADVVLEVNVWTGTASDCNTYDLVVSGAGCGPATVGTPFCDPATLNSTGFSTVLTGAWGSGVGSDLHLEMTGGVPGQLAYMLVGNEATVGFTIAGANGPLCLVGTPTAVFYRYNVPGPMNSIGGFDASATYINVAGTSTTGFGFDVPTMIPAAVPFAIMAGDTWHFQGWYRDTPAGSGQSNFSNGLSVTF